VPRKTKPAVARWRKIDDATPRDVWLLVSTGGIRDFSEARAPMVIARVQDRPSGSDPYACQALYGGWYMGAKWWRPLPSIPG
jgi:hypothetical protein